jgi:nucleotide-binding universal stress UspA family protein
MSIARCGERCNMQNHKQNEVSHVQENSAGHGWIPSFHACGTARRGVGALAWRPPDGAVRVDPYPYLGIGDTNLMGLQAYLSTANVHAGRALQEVAALCSQDGQPVDVQLRLAKDMPASEGILDAAQEEGADLIVVGSHGRSGINRLMLGSIASKVVSQSPIPVLVARAGDAS